MDHKSRKRFGFTENSWYSFLGRHLAASMMIHDPKANVIISGTGL